MSAPPRPNPLVHDTGTPPIPEARAWLARYDGRNGPAIDLSQAVPSHAPPPELLARLAEAAALPELARYGLIAGDLALREAYAAELERLYRAEVGADEVAITGGCNQAYFVAVMALAGRGDAVILPAPHYFNHAMTLSMLGIEARLLPCAPEWGFVPEAAEAERLIDGAVRAIVLVTPNNPTGAVYPPATIAAFQELCVRRGLVLILDETYRDFLPPEHGDAPPHDALARPGWGRNLVQLYSFSKSFAVPGHRLGALATSAGRLAEIAKVSDCVQICAARPGQAAVAWGIGHLDAWRAANRAEIGRRGAAFRRAVEALPGWRIDSAGAYFAYLHHPFPGVDAAEVAEALAVERGVLALPGPAFGPGQERHLRVAIANVDEARIAELPTRLAGFTPRPIAEAGTKDAA